VIDAKALIAIRRFMSSRPTGSVSSFWRLPRCPADRVINVNRTGVQEERARMLADIVSRRQIGNDKCGVLLADAMEDGRSLV
jgi:hypothetical protein